MEYNVFYMAQFLNWELMCFVLVPIAVIYFH